ncbi:MAG: MFS transporter [Steroidobacteraceae bacterium]
MSTSLPTSTEATVHPSLYLVLILPFGAVTGYLSVALAYALAQSGMSVARIGALTAIFFLPQAWKFLWAPIVDTTLTRKRWYFIGASMTAVGVLMLSVFSTHDTTFLVLTTFAVVASIAVTFLGMAVESLVAYGTTPEQKGRAGGWLQAGNLGGGGLGGGAALWLMQQVSQPWITGAALAACFMLCCLPLVFVADASSLPLEHGVIGRVSAVLKDIWNILRQRGGYLALLVVFLPIGTGAAQAYWSPLADEWHASANVVALINGAVGGVVAAFGCLVGGYICDHFNRKFCYIGFGLTLALCAVAMGLSPRNATTYVTYTILYGFGNGLCYAGFSAVTLEAIGHGAAATKYNVFASLSNMPITYMIAVEGWTQSRWGSSTMLFLEAALGVISAVSFTTVSLLSNRQVASPQVEAA